MALTNYLVHRKPRTGEPIGVWAPPVGKAQFGDRLYVFGESGPALNTLPQVTHTGESLGVAIMADRVVGRSWDDFVEDLRRRVPYSALWTLEPARAGTPLIEILTKVRKEFVAATD